VNFMFHFCFNSTLGFKNSAISEPFRFYIWHRKLARHGASLAFFQSNILKMPFPGRLCVWYNSTCHSISHADVLYSNLMSQGFHKSFLTHQLQSVWRWQYVDHTPIYNCPDLWVDSFWLWVYVGHHRCLFQIYHWVPAFGSLCTMTAWFLDN
jgi:hypothetical protein